MTSFFLYLSIVLFVIVCLFLILLVLIQKGRGGGLASAFGGAGGNTAFGSKTGDVLTWATSIVFFIFLLLAISINLLGNRYDAQRKAIGGIAPPPAAMSDEPSPLGPMSPPPPQEIPAAEPVIPAAPSTNPAP